MSSDHNRIKLEIYNRKKTGKSLNTWKLSNTLLHNLWAKEEVQKKLKLNENENKTFQDMWDGAQ